MADILSGSSRDISKKFPITRIKNQTVFPMEDDIIDEDIFTVVINENKTFKMVYSKTHPELLAAGFLFTQGVVQTQKDILDLQLNSQSDICRITLGKDAIERLKQFKPGKLIKGSSGGSLLSVSSKIDNIGQTDNFSISDHQVLSLIEQHWNKSELFQKTGAVHSASIGDSCSLTNYFEDIGRHNAVDKLAGYILLNDIDTTQKIVTLSCRMSLEIVGKLIRARIPVVISNAAPTLSAVKLADQSGLTIIGFARQNRFNIYTHPERITLEQP